MARYRNKYTGTTVNTEKKLGVEWTEIKDGEPLVLVAESGKVLDSKGDTVHPSNQEQLREEVKSSARSTKRRRDEPRKDADSE